ncbi:iron complex outermembrane recepter protein [Rhodoferax sp. OV413]|nr:iron complex outermembrane recepter protein [Rhodoferax sp. OV413]
MPATVAKAALFSTRLSPLAFAARLSLATSFALTGFGSAQAQALAPHTQYEIPAGPLAEALNRFAQQSGVAIVVDANKVQGLRSPGLHGSYELDEGFNLLLRGSGYVIAKTAAGYVLSPAPKSQDAASTTPTLPAVLVTASADLPGDLPKPYAGGQLARGARLGMLGNTDMMDAPLSSTSYTAQTIQNQQVRTVADVVVNDASVRAASQSGGILDAFFVRGFPVGNGNLGEIAFDGFYGVAPNYRVGTDYVERVEVIKGPTALIYGMAPSGSVGGGINIVPKRPADKDLSQFTADYASASQLGGHLDLSRRFGEDRQFGMRFNGSYRSGDTAQDKQSRQAGVGALALDYRGERLRATVDYVNQQENIDAPSRLPRMTAGIAVPAAADGRRNTTQPWEYAKVEDQSLLLRAEYDLTDSTTWSVGAGAGRTHVDRLFATSPVLLNTAGDVSALPSNFRFNIDRASVDTSLRSQFATASVHHSVSFQVSAYQDRLGRASNSAATALATNIYQPIDYAPQTVATPLVVPKVSETHLTGVALADTLSILDKRVQLTLGLRHQKIESDNFSETTGATTSQYAKSATTPMLGLVVKPWQNISLYANRIEGLTKGDTAPGTASNAGVVFAPYKSKQYELGVKIDHGRLSTTLSAFEIKKPSGQLTGSLFSVEGEQRNRGLEYNLFGEILPHIRVLASASLLDAKLTRTNSASTQGKTAVGVPSVQANLGLEWDTSFVPGLTFTGGLVHTGKQYANTDNTQSIPGWRRLDLGVRYATQLAGRTTTYRLLVRNVADKSYWASVDAYGGLVQADPRTLLLSATVNF